MNEYENEVKERWGDTSAYKQSKERTSKYSEQDFANAKADQEAAVESFLFCFGNSKAIDSKETQQAVIAHREAISKWFYDCSPEMQKNLAQMYVADERFKKYYDDRAPGLAQFVHDAIMAQ
jgi:hypothetical protein